jgi:hypothetical protein
MELKDVKVVYTEEAIKNRLATGDVHFTYRKKDGTEREAYGTRNTDIITINDAMPSGNGSEKTGVITYYDLNAKGWRSFKVENFIGFKTVCAA